LPRARPGAILAHCTLRLARPRRERRAMNAEEERELRAEVQRLKKRKLLLRDRITRIEDQLFPDIIA
jgi:hypothetical protein